ncbi:MAG: hypothetical protein K0V04_36635, partial [Deltaproteobacteria bacterium]|nr:hypothetical protein [Deltaproteobacteria bacterium]
MLSFTDAYSRRAVVLVPLLTMLACDPGEPRDGAASDPSDVAVSADEVSEHLTAALGTASSAGSIQTLAYHAEGFTDPPNQGVLPGDLAPSFPRTEFELDIIQDVGGDRIRIDRQGATPAPGFIVDQIERIDGNVGVAEGASVLGPLGAMTSDRVAALRRNQRLLNPTLLLSEVAADPGILLGAHFGFDGQSLLLVLELDDTVAPITVEVALVGPAGPSVKRVLTQENDRLMRDVAVEVGFSQWQWVGGWRLPHQVEVHQGGHLIHVEQRTDYVVNG